jgi:transposase
MEMDDEPVEPGAEVESAHTTARMSARSQRIEVITRGERRRRWSVEQKREIAAESLEPGISPITVARRYSISSGLLYTWRRHLLEGSLGTASGPGAKFARVEVLAMPAQPVPATPSLPRPVPAPNSLNHPEGTIEIALPGGVSVAAQRPEILLDAFRREAYMHVAPGSVSAHFLPIGKIMRTRCRWRAPPFYCPLACAPRQSQTMRIAIARSPAPEQKYHS